MPLRKHTTPESLNCVFALRWGMILAEVIVTALTLLGFSPYRLLRSMGGDLNIVSGVVGTAGGVPVFAEDVQ